MVSVSVTTLPALRSPVPLLIPVPEATTDDTVGAVVSICGLPWARPTERQVGGIAGTISDGRRIEIDRRRHQVRRVLPSRDHIAEGQRTGAGPAAIGRRAAVIERQCRRAARYSNRLAHGERQRHDLAGIEVAVQRRFRYTATTVGAVVSICSVPAGLVTAPERLAALPASSVIRCTERLRHWH